MNRVVVGREICSTKEFHHQRYVDCGDNSKSKADSSRGVTQIIHIFRGRHTHQAKCEGHVAQAEHEDTVDSEGGPCQIAHERRGDAPESHEYGVHGNVHRDAGPLIVAQGCHDVPDVVGYGVPSPVANDARNPHEPELQPPHRLPQSVVLPQLGEPLDQRSRRGPAGRRIVNGFSIQQLGVRERAAPRRYRAVRSVHAGRRGVVVLVRVLVPVLVLVIVLVFVLVFVLNFVLVADLLKALSDHVLHGAVALEHRGQAKHAQNHSHHDGKVPLQRANGLRAAVLGDG
mmetsp:Transcript_49712/g.95009  ORF Transcript_49712/g.95009 Transcript_49712/m.95009 type:complete len:286 (-) Transcript_49712:1513-2370(-)